MSAPEELAAAIRGFDTAYPGGNDAPVEVPAHIWRKWVSLARRARGDLPRCTQCGGELVDGGVKDGDRHLCLRCGGVPRDAGVGAGV